MKKNLILLFAIILSISVSAQEKEIIYNPELKGEEQIDAALSLAKESNKHVLVQVGGNWCSWCLLYNNYVNDDIELKKYQDDNFVVIHLNYSPENKNLKSLDRLEYPQRFGYPVFVILDADGKRLHTQNSALLEEGKGYNRRNVMSFYRNWTPSAVSPESYKK